MTQSFRDRQREFRRQEVVRTASEVIADVGCRDMTMDEVARRLGISKATLYSHFRSRDELIREAVARSFHSVVDGVREVADRAPERDRAAHAARFLGRLCLGVSGSDPDPGTACCLAEVECPYMRWDVLDQLLEPLAPRGENVPGRARAVRAVCAFLLGQRKAQGRRPTADDVEAVVRLLFPRGG